MRQPVAAPQDALAALSCLRPALPHEDSRYSCLCRRCLGQRFVHRINRSTICHPLLHLTCICNPDGSISTSCPRMIGRFIWVGPWLPLGATHPALHPAWRWRSKPATCCMKEETANYPKAYRRNSFASLARRRDPNNHNQTPSGFHEGLMQELLPGHPEGFPRD